MTQINEIKLKINEYLLTNLIKFTKELNSYFKNVTEETIKEQKNQRLDYLL